MAEGRDGDGAAPDPRLLLRTATVLHIALVLGVLTWAGIVAFLVLGREPRAEAEETMAPILPIVAGALTVMTVLPAAILGGQLVRRVAGATDLAPAQRAQRYLSTKVVIAAVIEGPGLLWGVLALVSGDLIHLAGALFSILALALVFPREEEFAEATGIRLRG